MKWFTLAGVWWRLRQGKSGHVAFIHKHTKRWTVLHYGPDGGFEATDGGLRSEGGHHEVALRRLTDRAFPCLRSTTRGEVNHESIADHRYGFG
jgi:hypothetical protein